MKRKYLNYILLYLGLKNYKMMLLLNIKEDTFFNAFIVTVDEISVV